MRIVSLLVFLFFGLLNVFAQQPSDQCSSPRQAQGVLVGAFRILNTAEMSYNQTNHQFATVSQLTSTDTLKKLSANKSYSPPVEGSIEIGSADDPLPGYTVHSIVGTDGKSYSITATKKDGPCKGVGATTNDRALLTPFVNSRWQRRQWVLDNKRAEYRELLSVVARSARYIANGLPAPVSVLDAQQQREVFEADIEARRVIADRILIANRMREADIQSRWAVLMAERDFAKFWHDMDRLHHTLIKLRSCEQFPSEREDVFQQQVHSIVVL
jgi:hypothetical protein